MSKQLYILCLSVLPLMVCSGMVYSILALYMNRELGASAGQIGMLYTAGAFAGAVPAPLIGRLSDKVGRRPVLVASMLGFTVAFGLYSALQNYLQAFPIQVLEGATWASLGSAALAYVADITPEEKRGWAMGVYERTWYVGWILGPSLGGYLADTVGFRTTFIAGASLILIGLALMLALLREPEKARGLRLQGQGAS